MRKTLKQSAVFPVMWLLYCAAVLVQSPEIRTGQAAAGVVAGAVVMAGLGFLLLLCVRGRNPSLVHLLILSGALVAADQLAKALLLRFLPADAQLAVVDGWVLVRHAPNHSNNVLFNLLGVELPSRAADVLFKVAALAVAVGAAVWVAREYRFARADVKIRVGAALLAAGAVCSVADTILLGYVLDFIVIVPLVSFDFKDLYLQFGIALLVLALFEQGGKAKATGGPPPGG